MQYQSNTVLSSRVCHVHVLQFCHPVYCTASHNHYLLFVTPEWVQRSYRLVPVPGAASSQMYLL